MTDWYIDQMKMKSYESEGLPISFKHDQYVGDKLDYAVHQDQTKNRWDIKDLIQFIASDDPRTILEMQNGQKIHFYPTNKVRIPIDKNTIIQNKVVDPKYNDSIVPFIDIEIKGQALYKNRLMMLDVIANNNWKRPVYFTGGSFGDDDYLWMKDFLQLDGMVYKLVPIRTTVPKDGSPLDMGQIDSEKMYNIAMKFDWGNGELKTIYHDPETRKNSISYRTNLARLMEQLINEGKKDKAKKIIDLAMSKMPVNYYSYYSLLDPFAGGYYEIGEKQKARQLLDQLMSKYKENLTFYRNLRPTEQSDIAIDIMTDIERYRSLLEVMKDRGDMEYYNKNKVVFNSYNKMFERFGRDME
jgi:tetratricopeptide (TPR) repeat protein